MAFPTADGGCCTQSGPLDSGLCGVSSIDPMISLDFRRHPSMQDSAWLFHRCHHVLSEAEIKDRISPWWGISKLQCNLWTGVTCSVAIYLNFDTKL
jgi:hypothetical protein